MAESTTKNLDVKIDPQEILAAGCHFGERVSVSHPKMKLYVFGVRNNVQLIDPEKIASELTRALHYISELRRENKVLLLIGTKPQVKKLVEETARACGLPWVAEKWLGGTFTNFEIIKKRIEHLKSLEKQKAEGELEKYTKQERIKIEKEMKGLETRFGGIKGLEKLPEAIFVCDMKKDDLPVREARRKQIKVIGIADTNVDPALADYPIPANDDAISSVKYILDRVKETIMATKSKTE